MSGIEDLEPGSRMKKASSMFAEELAELVQLYINKSEDRHRIIAILGTEFLDSMQEEGVPIESTLELILDEMDHRTREKTKPKEPFLRLIKNT